MGAGREKEIKVEEIIEEKIIAPKIPEVKELPRVELKGELKLSQKNVLALISALKKTLDQEPYTIESFVLAQVAGVPTLLIGPHGSGKTTLAKTFYRCLTVGGRPIKWKYVNVKEAQSEYTVYARPNYAALVQGREEWVAKAIDAEAIFIDEVFRNTRIFAALNEILEEKTFENLPVKWKFVVCATNPPNAFYRTVDLLNYADLDRFGAILYVEDRGMDFADTLASSPSLEVDVKLDVNNVEEAREKIGSLKASYEALTLAKILTVSFSACLFEDAGTGVRLSEPLWNKFACISEMRCYRCVHQRHCLCSRYAVAPKRALRSLLALARARAWVLGRSRVSAEDVWWAFKAAFPGRAAVIDRALAESIPSYRALAEKMAEDFLSWYSRERDTVERLPLYSPDSLRNDPVLFALKLALKPKRVVRGYRVIMPKEKAARLMKYFV
ncbi:MAG: hypothetical protein DRJ52_10775, partial [Thermoprotei archaeon]